MPGCWDPIDSAVPAAPFGAGGRVPIDSAVPAAPFGAGGEGMIGCSIAIGIAFNTIVGCVLLVDGHMLLVVEGHVWLVVKGEAHAHRHAQRVDGVDTVRRRSQ